jgi:hypothetical protein
MAQGWGFEFAFAQKKNTHQWRPAVHPCLVAHPCPAVCSSSSSSSSAHVIGVAVMQHHSEMTILARTSSLKDAESDVGCRQ